MILPLFPRVLIMRIAGPEEAKNPAGRGALRLIQIRSDAESGENLACLSTQKTDLELRFELEKRGQLFSRPHVSARPLRDHAHRELMLQLNERSQLFIGTHGAFHHDERQRSRSVRPREIHSVIETHEQNGDFEDW